MWIDKLLFQVGKSGSFDKVSDFVENLVAEGFSVTQFISQLHDKVTTDQDLSDHQKSSICEKLAIAEARLIDGANEYLQLLDITTLVMNQLSKS